MRRWRRMDSLSSPAGVTLVEVLVAVVLLLIGILAVVRIYPTGLDLIRHGSSRSLALRLAEEQMEQWKNRSNRLPDAIAAVDPQGNWKVRINPEAEFETKTPDLDWQSESAPEGYEQLESLWYRRICREQAVIPAGGTYPLAAGLPKIDPNRPVAKIDPNHPVEITTRYHRSPYNSAGELSLTSDQRNYAIDYSTREVWFDNDLDADRSVWIDFTYIDGSTGQRQRILQELHRVPQAPQGATAPTRTVELLGYSVPLPPGSTLVRGSETVRRLLISDSRAPYQFKVRPELGLVEFAPENAGLPVEISYTVLDWRILQEEKTVVRSGSQLVIHTTLPFILNQREDPSYGGLYGTGNGPDIQVVDVEAAVPLNVDTDRTNYRTGRIVLAGNAYEGQQVRVFYRTRDRWAVQPMKAAGAYQEDWRSADFDPEAPNLRAYRRAQAEPGRYRYGLVGGRLCLAFYPSERGQAVVVDYSYDDDPNDPIPPVAVEGEMHIIPAPADPSADPQEDPEQGMCLVSLNTPVQGSRQFTINRVHGTSLRIRVSWHEKAVIKYVDLNTYLTRL